MRSRISGGRRRAVTRARVPALAAAAALSLAGTADAATVAVRPDPGTVSKGSALAAYDEVHYVAGDGERNRLTVAYAGDARSVTVTDPGAVITAVAPCQSIDPHTALCTRRPQARLEWLQSTRVELGDLDDRLQTTPPGPAPIGGVVANGGPDDDLLDGGSGSDRLTGGGGRDEIFGGAGVDVLSDGDFDGAAGKAAPGPDVLDGGADADVIDYSQRTVGVWVVLPADTAGAAGENDVLANFENATGGSGDDRLEGDDTVNRLIGGEGSDTLFGRGGMDVNGAGDRLSGGGDNDFLYGESGPDNLRGGSGYDELSCGPGPDVVRAARPGEFLSKSCERLSYSFGPGGANDLSFRPNPTSIRRDFVSFALSCPRFESRDGELTACSGTLQLREPGGRRRLLATGRVADAGNRATFSVRARLSALAKRKLRRGKDFATTASIRGQKLPSVAWSIKLRR